MLQALIFLCSNCMQMEGQELSKQVHSSTTMHINEFQVEQEIIAPTDAKKKCKGGRPKQ